MPEHLGVDYISFMGYMAKVLRPASYLEIGTNTGASLTQFSCDSVCVDPNFQINRDILLQRKRSFFFQMTSDEFFATNNLFWFFPGGVDIAFLDGLHRFEFLLRDFINTERFCHPSSIVLIHDCLPYNVEITTRSFLPGDWAGDVCRILPLLRKYRPDLRIRLLDCPPTGLVACTSLNPQSTVLAERYQQIVDEFLEYELTECSIKNHVTLFPCIDTSPLMQHPEHMTALFPLFPAPFSGRSPPSRDGSIDHKMD
jgi:hypothetical protein